MGVISYKVLSNQVSKRIKEQVEKYYLHKTTDEYGKVIRSGFLISG